jgi:hypothetical protein
MDLTNLRATASPKSRWPAADPGRLPGGWGPHFNNMEIVMICQTCSSSGCTGKSCETLECELPKMSRGMIIPVSWLSFREIVVTAMVSWEDVTDRTLPSSEFKPFPFLGSRDNNLLHDRICLRMRHKELSEKYGLTIASCRMTLMRIRRKIDDKVSV